MNKGKKREVRSARLWDRTVWRDARKAAATTEVEAIPIGSDLMFFWRSYLAYQRRDRSSSASSFSPVRHLLNMRYGAWKQQSRRS